MTVDFLSETMQVRRQRSHIFKVLGEQNYQPEIFTRGKISLKNEGKIKLFPSLEIQKLKEFISCKSAVYKMFKGVFQEARNDTRWKCGSAPMVLNWRWFCPSPTLGRSAISGDVLGCHNTRERRVERY